MSGRCPSSKSTSNVEPITWAIRPVAVAVAIGRSPFTEESRMNRAGAVETEKDAKEKDLSRSSVVAQDHGNVDLPCCLGPSPRPSPGGVGDIRAMKPSAVSGA